MNVSGKSKNFISSILKTFKVKFLLNTLPLISPHFEKVASVHATGNAKAIADEDVKDPAVPPAFSKVGQEMGKGDFSYLPGDRDSPAEAVVSHEKGLHRPA